MCAEFMDVLLGGLGLLQQLLLRLGVVNALARPVANDLACAAARQSKRPKKLRPQNCNKSAPSRNVWGPIQPGPNLSGRNSRPDWAHRVQQKFHTRGTQTAQAPTRRVSSGAEYLRRLQDPLCAPDRKWYMYRITHELGTCALGARKRSVHVPCFWARNSAHI